MDLPNVRPIGTHRPASRRNAAIRLVGEAQRTIGSTGH